MKSKALTIGLVSIFLVFLGCDRNPIEPKETLFWEYSGPIDEDGIRWGLEVTCVLASENVVLLGTLEDGVITSKDNGKTWHHQGFNGKPVYALAGSIDKEIWLGTSASRLYNGVWISYGADPFNWEEPGELEYTVYSIAPDLNNYRIFAGTNYGLFNTINNLGWQKAGGQNYNFESARITALLVTQANVFAGTDKGKLFLSANYDGNWSEITDTPFANAKIEVMTVSEGDILIGADGVYCSSDNGKTWTRSLNYKTLDFALYKEVVYAGTANGIYVSEDNGKTWTAFSTDGLDDIYVTALAVSQDNHLLAGTKTKGLFRSTEPLE